MTTLPLQTSLEHLAAFGLVEAIHATMNHIDPTDAASDMALEELWCLSGAATSIYVWDPKVNLPDAQGELDDFHWSGELFSNYGVFESLSYVTGWEIKEFNFLARDAFTKLLEFELMHGRPMVTLGAGRPLHTPSLLAGMEQEPGRSELHLLHAKEGVALQTLDFNPLDSLQAEHDPEAELFQNWCLLCRPGEPAPWAASPGLARMQMLRWSVQHFQREREFFHETQLNYATGASAIKALWRMRQGSPSAEHLDYLDHVHARVALGWRALAGQLVLWVEELDQFDDVSFQDASLAAAKMREAASLFKEAASLIEPAQSTDLESVLHTAKEAISKLDDGIKEVTTPL